MKYFYFFTFFLIINSLLEEEEEEEKDFIKSNFSSFKKKYNKNYNEIEEEISFNIFKWNYEHYGSFNEFSDLFDWNQAKDYFDKWKKLPEHISYAYLWDKANNQLKCGNCYEFSFITQIEAQFEIKFNKTYRFSSQELLDCSGGIIGCQGGNNNKMINFLKNRNYLILENAHEAFDGKSEKERCIKYENNNYLYKNSVKMKVEKIDFENYEYENRINCMKAYLIKHGPIGASIVTTDEFKNFKDPYSNKIFELPQGCQNLEYRNPFSVQSDHAFAIIGYKDYNIDKKTNKKETFWIIRNSWGDEWGKEGYAKIKAGYNICGIEYYNEYLEVNWDSWCGEGCFECNYYKKNFYCYNCLEGYEFDQKEYGNYFGKCIKCLDGCKYCKTQSNVQICNECFDGYWLDIIENKCKQCYKGCKKCTGPKKNNCLENYSLKLSNESEDEEIKDYCARCKSYSINSNKLILLIIYILFF